MRISCIIKGIFNYGRKRDYYEVLGVSKTATDAEIKKAFRQQAKKYHPDIHPGDKECEEKFKEAQEAYAVLSDPDKRRQYDQFGHAAFDGTGGGAGGFDFSGMDMGDILVTFRRFLRRWKKQWQKKWSCTGCKCPSQCKNFF